MASEVPYISALSNCSNCSNRCRIPVLGVSFSRSVNVTSNIVSVVVVLEKTLSRYLFSSLQLSGVSQTTVVALVSSN